MLGETMTEGKIIESHRWQGINEELYRIPVADLQNYLEPRDNSLENPNHALINKLLGALPPDSRKKIVQNHLKSYPR